MNTFVIPDFITSQRQDCMTCWLASLDELMSSTLNKTMSQNTRCRVIEEESISTTAFHGGTHMWHPHTSSLDTYTHTWKHKHEYTHTHRPTYCICSILCVMLTKRDVSFSHISVFLTNEEEIIAPFFLLWHR